MAATILSQLGTAVVGAGGAATAVTYQAAANPDTFANTGRESLHVKNGSGSTVTVTITSQVPCSQGITHNPAFTVAAGAEGAIGALDSTRFNDPATGLVTVNYSSIVTVTVAVVRTS